MASPDRFYRLGRHGTRRRHLRQLPSVRAPESQAIVRTAFDLVSLLVDRAVMPPTEQCQIGERCRAALRPVVEVMALGHPHSAPREAAALIPLLERPSEGRRDGPGPSPDLHYASLAIVPEHHRLASHARRRDVSAETRIPSSNTVCPGCVGSASTGASTCTTTW